MPITWRSPTGTPNFASVVGADRTAVQAIQTALQTPIDAQKEKFRQNLEMSEYFADKQYDADRSRQADARLGFEEQRLGLANQANARAAALQGLTIRDKNDVYTRRKELEAATDPKKFGAMLEKYTSVDAAGEKTFDFMGMQTDAYNAGTPLEAVKKLTDAAVTAMDPNNGKKLDWFQKLQITRGADKAKDDATATKKKIEDAAERSRKADAAITKRLYDKASNIKKSVWAWDDSPTQGANFIEKYSKIYPADTVRQMFQAGYEDPNSILTEQESWDTDLGEQYVKDYNPPTKKELAEARKALGY